LKGASVVDASPTLETNEQVSEAFHSMMHIPSSQPHRAHIGLTVSPDHKIWWYRAEKCAEKNATVKLYFLFFFGRGVTGAVAKARRFEVVTARRLFLRPKGEIVRFPKYQMDPA
jgi:hypothetical protein